VSHWTWQVEKRLPCLIVKELEKEQEEQRLQIEVVQSCSWSDRCELHDYELDVRSCCFRGSAQHKVLSFVNLHTRPSIRTFPSASFVMLRFPAVEVLLALGPCPGLDRVCFIFSRRFFRLWVQRSGSLG
jgi:hypothetical protein